MSNELHRPWAIDRLAHGARVVIDATPAEREAVARRMNLPGLAQLHCSFELRAAGGPVISARGHLRARVTYHCVLTLDPFDAVVEEDFAVRFVPAGQESEELDVNTEDEIPYDSSSIDLGEAATEQLALALDPFPRKPESKLPAAAQSLGGPFAALAKLRGGNA